MFGGSGETEGQVPAEQWQLAVQALPLARKVFLVYPCTVGGVIFTSTVAPTFIKENA